MNDSPTPPPGWAPPHGSGDAAPGFRPPTTTGPGAGYPPLGGPPSGGFPVAGQGGPPSGGFPAAGQGGPPSGGFPAAGQGQARPKRSKKAIVIAIVGVLAVAGVGVTALRATSGSGGGASSPEAAVDSLAQAISSEDMVGLASSLAPDEVRSLGDLLAEVEDKAGVDGFAGSSRTFAGVDVTVEDLDLDVDELGDDVARVTVRNGTASYRLEEGDLAERTQRIVPGDLATNDSVDVRDITGDEGVLPDDLYLMTIKQDGGWYVSLAYTAAEYAAEAWDLPDGDFDDLDDLGDAAETPEDAVLALVDAGGSLEPESVREQLPSGEWQVFAAYERAITEILEGDSPEVRVSVTDVELDVDDADLSVEEVTSSTRRVTVESGEGDVSWTDEYGDSRQAEWSTDGWCLDVTTDVGDESSTCVLDNDSLLGQVLDVPDPYVVVVSERGGWVVSPTATVIDMARAVVPQLTPDLILNLLGRPDLVDPVGPAAVGDTLDVEIGDGGATSYTLTPEADATLAISIDDWEDVDDHGLFASDGEYVDWEDGGQAVTAGEEYRIAVSGDPGASVALVVGEVVTEPLPGSALTSGLSGEVSATVPVRRYPFTPADDATVSMEVSGNVSVDIDGDSYCSAYDGGSDTCSLEGGGDYVLTVSADGGEGDAFEVAFEAGGAATIDGDEFLTDVVYYGSPNVHYVTVAPGTTAYFVLESDSGYDIDVSWDDATSSGGSGSFGSIEEFEITGPFDGELRARLYTSSAYSSGYSISVSTD